MYCNLALHLMVRMGHITDLHHWGEIHVVLDFNVLTKAGQLLRYPDGSEKIG
jgi:hypothetical protein